MPCLPTALVALAALAGPAPRSLAQQTDAPQSFEYGTWYLLDRVEIVANTDCLTLSTLDKRVNQDKRMNGTTTPQQYQALRTKIALENVDNLLKRQAGEDLGFDETIVKARANDIWEDRVTEKGGITRATRELTSSSETVTEKREEIEGDLYSMSWTSSVLGRDAGPGGRPMFDRFTRPGLLRQRYERMVLTGLEVEQALKRAGARPAQYQFQVLLVDPRRLGSEEAARQKAEQIRAALVAEEVDWEDALLNFGELPSDVNEIDRRSLLGIYDPGSGVLASFMDEAALETFSPVVPLAPLDPRGRRSLRGFAIYKLLGRTEAYVPPFTEPGVQKELQRYMRLQRDEARYKEGLDELRKKAYVWYPGIEQEEAQVEAARDAREQQGLELREQREQAQEATRDEVGESKPEGEDGVDGDEATTPTEDSSER